MISQKIEFCLWRTLNNAIIEESGSLKKIIPILIEKLSSLRVITFTSSPWAPLETFLIFFVRKFTIGVQQISNMPRTIIKGSF